MDSAYRIKCACCGADEDEDAATFDPQMNGPVCRPCAMRFVKITAWLSHYGMSRPVSANDVNEGNHKRFIVP